MDDKPLVISAPSQGVGPSPHLGFEDVRNLDIYTIPGVVRLNNPLAKKSASVVTGLVKWKVKNPLVSTQIWGVDDAGVVYKSTDSGDTWAVVAGNTAGGTGQGLAIWKDYLFVPRSTAIDVYGPLAGAPAWSNSWKTIDADILWHPMLVSFNDSMLYGGAGRYVFSLDEVTAATFAPGTAASFSWTQQALDLPVNYRIKSIAELGNNLMLGTWMGTNIYDFKVADIFPWDRSAVSFGSPLIMKENGANAMLNIDNQLYIQAGIDGKLFLSNGVSVSLIAQIPSSIANLEGGGYIETFPGALVNYKGRPFWGVSSTTAVGGLGVWSLLQTSQGNVLNFEHTISTNSSGASNLLKIGSLLSSTRDILLVGWLDNATYGIDKTDITTRQTGYTGYFRTPLYQVGTTLVKKQYTQIMFQLVKALASNEGIKIKQRINLTDSFTTIGTFDFATLGAVISHNTEATVPGAEFCQFQVELTGTTTTPQLRDIILI